MPEPHFLYVISATDGSIPQSPCKLGITGNLEQRFKQLQSSTACPYKLHLVLSVETPDKEIAAAIEQSFHATQQSRRTRGEWYSAGPAEMVALVHIAFGVALSVHGVASDDINKYWHLAHRNYLPRSGALDS